MSARILVLFSLVEGHDIEEYRRWSAERVHPGMRANGAVLAFADYALTPVAGDPAGYNYCEIIDVTSQTAFQAENRSGTGLELSEAWRARMARFAVIYLDPLLNAEVDAATEG